MRRFLLRLLEPQQYRRSDAANRHCMAGLAGKVLDIGCGFFAQKFPFGSAVAYIGLDISDRARDVKGDAHCLPFGDGVVDWVLLVGVLEHVEDPAHVLAEAWRVLKPGGYGYIAVPFLQMEHAAHDYWRWTRQGFTRVLTGQGFVVEEMVTNGGFLLVLEYLLWHRLREAIRERSLQALAILPLKVAIQILARAAGRAACDRYAASFHARVRKPLAERVQVGG